MAVRGQGTFAAKRYNFYYDSSDRLLTEVAVASDGTATPEHNYYWLAGQPLAQERLDGTGGLLYIHPDFLGTPQRMSTPTGKVKWAARYSPFGEVGDGDINPAVDCAAPLADLALRFPGQYDDRRKGTGYFYYNFHRYYDPAVGQYAQIDPLLVRHPKRRHPLSRLHAYVYVAGNPITLRDPTGTTITTFSPQVETALQNLKLADPFLKELIDQLERTTDFDVEVHDVGTWADPAAWRTLIEGGWQGAGTKWDCENRKVYIPFSTDVVQMIADIIGEGFFYSPEQVLGHELGHAYNDPWGPLPAGSVQLGPDEPFALGVENLLRAVPRLP